MQKPLPVNTDFVGDIHAGYEKFTGLLKKLGYKKRRGVFSHPENRHICFLGDIINIGSDNLKVLKIIRDMCDKGNATCICGNHEFAIYRYWMQNPDFFASRILPKNFEIYIPLLTELKTKIRFNEIMEWIGGLPVVKVQPEFVAVHAYWNDEYEKKLSGLNQKELTANVAALIIDEKNNPLKNIVFNLIYGKRMALADPLNPFRSIPYRYAWWNTHKESKCNDVVISRNKEKIPNAMVAKDYLTPDTQRPVFFGHYWLKTKPYLTHPYYCCLDFGGAKGGYLTAYHFDENTILCDKSLVFI